MKHRLAVILFAIAPVAVQAADTAGLANRNSLKNSGFMAAFTDKGRFSDMLGKMPVRVILEPRTALNGAAVAALQVV